MAQRKSHSFFLQLVLILTLLSTMATGQFFRFNRNYYNDASIAVPDFLKRECERQIAESDSGPEEEANPCVHGEYRDFCGFRRCYKGLNESCQEDHTHSRKGEYRCADGLLCCKKRHFSSESRLTCNGDHQCKLTVYKTY